MKIITSLKILASSALLLCLTTPVHATEDPSRPNVLAIWGDDIGMDNLSAYTMGQAGHWITTQKTLVLLVALHLFMANIQCVQA